MSRNIRAYLIPSEDHRRLNEFIGLLLATIAVLVGLSLISFNPEDPSFNISRNPEFPDKAHNFIGRSAPTSPTSSCRCWGLRASWFPFSSASTPSTG